MGDAGLDAGLPSDAGPTAAVCVPGLLPTLSDLSNRIFIPSCGGSNEVNICHGGSGVSTAGGLDLLADPYHALLGDGGGAPAENLNGSATGLLRVKPGDPLHSFLILKLQDSSTHDPRYGHGMPYFYPASICPQTLAAIESWISDGGPND